MRYYCESHFVLEKLRLIKEERDALIILVAEELARMPELGFLPQDPTQPITFPGMTSISVLSTRLHKARLLAEHLIKNVIVHVQKLDTKLGDMLADPQVVDLMRAQVYELQDADTMEKHKMAIDAYHKELGPGIIDTQAHYAAFLDTLRVSEEELDNLFSGAESHGRHLNLYPAYELYSKLSPSIGYLAFLRDYAKVELLPTKERMHNHHYEAYLDHCISYQSTFISKTFPLVQNIDNQLAAVKGEFESNWTRGEYPEDWAECIAETNVVQPRSDLYCLPCQHLFTNPSVYEAHLKGKKHLKAAEKCTEGYVDATTVEAASEKQKRERLSQIHNLAGKEKLLRHYAQLLEKIQTQTVENLERRQAMTPEEIQKEEELLAQQDAEFTNLMEESGVERKKRKLTDFKDELPEELFDGGVYNPLKLPLDWDGKPIPYWLWKLHGLGTKYSCEICGGHEYAGRKAFDAHFFEWRHSHGLKSLGIPNTRHFFHVTKISEALALWDKLRTQAKKEVFRPEAMEEVEDHLGNVYNKRVYIDLKKQGLLP